MAVVVVCDPFISLIVACPITNEYFCERSSATGTPPGLLIAVWGALKEKAFWGIAERSVQLHCHLAEALS